MKIKLPILIVFLFPLFVQAQFEIGRLPFSVDSLKKVLPLLNDSARVDCLNGLSEAHVYLNNDTATYYAELAYQESMKINYVHGIAEALSWRVRILDARDTNYPLEEKLSREAIGWYRKTLNKKGLAETYLNLGGVLHAQSFFTDAIKNSDTAYYWFNKNGNTVGIYWVFTLSRAVYTESGNYEKAFEFARKGLDMAIQNNNDRARRYELTQIGELFAYIGDHGTALEYYREAFRSIKPEAIVDSLNVTRLLGFAELLTYQHQYDSAKYYYHFVDTSGPRAQRFYLISIGNLHFAQKQYDKALCNFLRGLNYHKQYNDRNQVMNALLVIARTYLAMKNDTAAIRYAHEGLKMAKQTGAKQFIKDACEILSSIFDRWNHPDSAYLYYKQYTAIKDSILNDQIKGRLAAYTFEQKIELLNKEKEIQQVQLQKQSLLKNILIGGIITLLLLAAIIFRNIILKRRNEKLKLKHELELQKIESEKIKAELQQQATELEMQALRAQMNPHFIFNCLNSINRFVLQNETEAASDYLTKFSRLIRMVLNNSKHKYIPLNEELDCLELYIQLEQLRFKNSFQYKIESAIDIDAEELLVPPMLLQPFIENAIWHGLIHKDIERGQGYLDILVQQRDEIIEYTIADNGMGRKATLALNNKSAGKYKSMGLQITKERIALLDNQQGIQSIEIEDLYDNNGNASGTKVLLRIKYNVPVEKVLS
jgi:hypothetical protein